MDTEHRFNPGDRVRFKGSVWEVTARHGNRIYTVSQPRPGWPERREFAYEGELAEAEISDLLTESIAQAKAKKNDS